MSRTEAAIRRAGALAALVASSALTGFPRAVEAHEDVALVLALQAILLLGCAAVLFSPAHGAVAGLARRAKEAARGTVLGAPAALLRWFGFASIVLYALVDVAARKEAAASLDTAKGLLLFLMFLAGVWAVHLSMVAMDTGRRGPPPWPPAPGVAVAAAAGEEDPDGGEVNVMAPRPARVVVDSKVWNILDLS